MTTQEQIAIMQAYVDGKQIQIDVDNRNKWTDIIEPSWDWVNNNYRIKSEPTYRPYKDLVEFLKDWEKHEGLARNKCSNSNRRLIKAYNDEIADTLLTYYTWADDGTPCGIKVED